MPTFVLLTRLSPESVRSPETLERLEGEAMERIRDYLDIFNAPDVETAAKVAAQKARPA